MEDSFVNTSCNERKLGMRGIDLPRTRDQLVTRRSIGVWASNTITMLSCVKQRWIRSWDEGGLPQYFWKCIRVKSGDWIFEIDSRIGRIFVGFVMILAI